MPSAPMDTLELHKIGFCTTWCYDLLQQHEVTENMNEQRCLARVSCDTAVRAHGRLLFTPPPPPLTWRLEVRQP